MKKRLIQLLLLFTASTAAIAGVYKCNVNGKVVFSQTKCAASAQSVRIYDSDKYHEDAALLSRLDAIEAERDAEFDNRRRNYERRRDVILREMKNLNFSLNQSLSSLMKKKAKRRQLKFELEIVQRDWENYLDPTGANDRRVESKIDDMRKEIRNINKKPLVQNKKLTINGKSHYCQQIGNHTRCR